jgi:hypothetical protein
MSKTTATQIILQIRASDHTARDLDQDAVTERNLNGWSATRVQKRVVIVRVSSVTFHLATLLLGAAPVCCMCICGKFSKWNKHMPLNVTKLCDGTSELSHPQAMDLLCSMLASP